jgi:hypothetical protein
MKHRNYESINARLYRDFYDTNKMPKGLCEYSWKSLIMYLGIIPATLFSFPMFIWYFIQVIVSKDKKMGWDFSTRFIFSMFIYIIIGGVCCSLITLLNCFGFVSSPGSNVIICGWSFIVIVLFVVFMFIREEHSDKTTIIGDVIKTKFEGICPRIEWDNLPDWQKPKN